jgi:hypothetical protein
VVSSTNKADHHDITEILLKVALKTITLTKQICPCPRATLLKLMIIIPMLKTNITETYDYNTHVKTNITETHDYNTHVKTNITETHDYDTHVKTNIIETHDYDTHAQN